MRKDTFMEILDYKVVINTRYLHVTNPEELKRVMSVIEERMKAEK